MANNAGLNINAEAAGSDRQAIADFQCNWKSNSVTITDDYKQGKWFFTQQIHARSPHTRINHRHFLAKDPNDTLAGGWEGNLPETPAGTGTLRPDDFVNFLASQDGTPPPSYVYHQIMNEPAVYGSKLRDYLAWLIRGMDVAAARQQRWCVYNAQTVAIRKEDIDAGVYDELLFALAKYRGLHVLGLHEYGLGILPANVSNAAIARMVQPGAFPTSRWYTEVCIPVEAHIGRYKLLLARARSIGATPIARPMITEFGWDDVRLSVRDAVASVNERPPMGAITLDKLWWKHYQMTRDECAYQQTRWAKAFYGEEADICFYSADTSFENGLYHLGDMKEWQKLCLGDLGTTAPQPPPVVTLPPTIPDEPKRDWRGELGLDERSVLSLMKDGKLGAIEKLVLHMTDILDELTEHEGHEG